MNAPSIRKTLPCMPAPVLGPDGELARVMRELEDAKVEQARLRSVAFDAIQALLQIARSLDKGCLAGAL